MENETKEAPAPAREPGTPMIPGAIAVGKWEIPPITMETAMLFERIDSPFLRDPEPLRDQAGNPVLDDQGRPKLTEQQVTVTEFARTLYVLVNQDDPRLDMILANPESFDLVVRQMAREVSFAEMRRLSEAIKTQMQRVNAEVRLAGLEQSPRNPPETGSPTT